jgi:hypothetical protein
MNRAEPSQVESVLADAAIAGARALPGAHMCQSMLNGNALA